MPAHMKPEQLLISSLTPAAEVRSQHGGHFAMQKVQFMRRMLRREVGGMEREREGIIVGERVSGISDCKEQHFHA